MPRNTIPWLSAQWHEALPGLHTSNFKEKFIGSTCSKHENAHHWLRVNHDPSVGNDNIIFMRRAIGYENLQVNAIRIVADTRDQEIPKSPRVQSGSRKYGHKPSWNPQERQETLTAGGPQIPRASLPYEVIHIKVKDKQTPAVITYDTGAEFSFCNKDAELMANSIEKTRRNLMISTINNVQSGPMQLCKLKLENGQDIEAIMLPNME